MKTSDEELAKHIKDVFEDYNDGLSEHGWAELRKKYPEKRNKKLPIWWLTRAAATLLLVLGLYFNNSIDTEKIALKVNTSKTDSSFKQAAENKKTEDIAKATATNVSTKSEKAVDKNNGIISAPLQLRTQQVKTANHTTNEKLAGTTAGAKEQTNIGIINDNLVASANQTNTNNIDNKLNQGNEAAVETSSKTDNETKNTKLSTEEFLNQQSKILAANDNKKETKKNNAPNTTLDVFTGTFFNYNNNNEAKLSAGAGLNANVKVTKNLVFSFGAGISQNKVSYENKVPVEVSQSMFASKADMSASLAPSSNMYSATATNDMSFNGRLLSIDLPMVVKFFPSKKQDFYISTGINSSSYITQKYTYNYSSSNFSYRNGEAQPHQETEESTLKGFDFANSAIIAIGINQSIGKNILIFEPYYKPALSTMGDKNLRISSAGLNLKFNFNGNAKK